MLKYTLQIHTCPNLGNSNLVYTIIRKRHVFHSLANLPTDPCSINKSLLRKSPLMKKPTKAKEPKETCSPTSGTSTPSNTVNRPNKPAPLKERTPSTESTVSNASQSSPASPSMEGSHPALPAEPGTLKASLAILPRIDKMTEEESAHPTDQQLSQWTRADNGIATFENLSINSTENIDTASCATTTIAHLTNPHEDDIGHKSCSGSDNSKKAISTSKSMPFVQEKDGKLAPKTAVKNESTTIRQMQRSFSMVSAGVIKL